MNGKKQIIRFALYAIVIVLFNIAFQTLFFRIDLTSVGSYSLTDVSKKTVKELQEPLTVKIYITENMPYPYNNLEQNLKDTLAEYALAGNRNFNYDIYLISNLDKDKADTSDELEKEAQGYGINPIQIQQVDQSEINLTSAYMGAVFIHADMIQTIPVINPNENIEYLLTSTVLKMEEKTSKLLSLDEDVKIKLYLSSSLFGASADLAAYPDKLKTVVDELNKTNYNRISYEWIDTDRKSAPETADYGFNAYKFDDGNGNISQSYASAVIEYKDNFTTFDVLSRGIFGYTIQDPAKIQDQINGVVERLIGVGNKVAWLADHGAIQLYSSQQQQYNEPTVSTFAGLASQRYSLEPFALSTDMIPEDAGSLIIARPQPFSKFTDWELFQIDQFLMQGKDVAVFTDGYMEYLPPAQQGQQQQPPIYIPRDTGLEEMLKFYGIGIGKSYVMDESCFHQQQQSAQGVSDIPVYFAPQIKPENINQDLPYMKGIQGLLTLNNSPVEISGDLPEGRTATVLYSSSDKSWLMEDQKQMNLYNPMMIMPPTVYPDGGKYPLAAVLEGSFTSYFTDKGVPERPEPPEGSASETDENYQFGADQVSQDASFIKSTESGRLFVFGSSMQISDNLIPQNGTSTNGTLVLNVLDEMNGNGDYALMRRKGLNYNPIKDTEPALRTFIKTFNMVVVPVLVIAAGLLVWLGWNRRQRKIASMFTEADNE